MVGMFWLRGKYFDNLDEMIDYEKKWQDAKIDEESVEFILELLKSNLSVNLPLCKSDLKNHELCAYANEIFHFAVNLYQRKNE